AEPGVRRDIDLACFGQQEITANQSTQLALVVPNAIQPTGGAGFVIEIADIAIAIEGEEQPVELEGISGVHTTERPNLADEVGLAIGVVIDLRADLEAAARL